MGHFGEKFESDWPNLPSGNCQLLNSFFFFLACGFRTPSFAQGHGQYQREVWTKATVSKAICRGTVIWVYIGLVTYFRIFTTLLWVCFVWSVYVCVFFSRCCLIIRPGSFTSLFHLQVLGLSQNIHVLLIMLVEYWIIYTERGFFNLSLQQHMLWCVVTWPPCFSLDKAFFMEVQKSPPNNSDLTLYFL